MRFDPQGHEWVTDALAELRRDFLPSQLEPLLATAGFDGCVAVEARKSEAETEFLLGLADTCESVLAVVGWVDLAAPDVDERVEHWAAHPKLVGVRHLLLDEPDDYLLSPAVARGLLALERAGLTYDLLVAPRHYAVAVRVIDAHPGLRFVLDHCGLPRIRRRDFERWRPGMAEIARRPNIAVKLSGLEFLADWQGWTPADLRPYQDATLEAFGPDRTMIASNWPVSTISGSYAGAVATNRAPLATLSQDEQAAVLGGTCARWYGIPTPAPRPAPATQEKA